MNFKSMKNELAKKVFCVANRLMYCEYPFYSPYKKETFIMKFWQRVFSPVMLDDDFNGTEGVKFRFIGTFFIVPGSRCLGDEGWEDLFKGYYGFGRPEPELEGFSADLAEA